MNIQKKSIRLFLLIFILTETLHHAAYAQWVSNTAVNVPVSVAGNDQQDERIVSDGKGGAIIVWEDYRTDLINASVFVQRVDKFGLVKWSINGVAVCDQAGQNHTTPAIVEDGDGGAIIVWQEKRNGDKDLYAQKVDSNGIVKWAACGLPVIVKSGDQQNARIVSDSQHGAIVFWEDSVSGGNWDIGAQHVDANGAQLWTSSGVIVSNAIEKQLAPRADVDDAGGAVVVWQDHRNGTDYDIYAQRLSAGGTAMWTLNGLAVCSSVGSQNSPKIKTDHASGAYIAWTDKRNGTDYNIFAQKITSAGVSAWATNGVSVCSASGTQNNLDITTGNMTGLVIAWEDQRGADRDLYAQKLDVAGLAQWTSNGVAVCNTSSVQANINVDDDGHGGMIIAWEDSSAGEWNVLAQRVDSSGGVRWSSSGAAVGTANGNQTRPKNISDGSGGSIFVFQDKRSVSNFDLYAHHLLSNGAPDGIPNEKNSDENLLVFPQPADSKFSLSCRQCLIKDADVYIVDLCGRDMTNHFLIQKETSSLEFINVSAENGMYLLHIQFKDGKQRTEKIIFIK